jgi:hypothetical protein
MRQCLATRLAGFAASAGIPAGLNEANFIPVINLRGLAASVHQREGAVHVEGLKVDYLIHRIEGAFQEE